MSTAVKARTGLGTPFSNTVKSRRSARAPAALVVEHRDIELDELDTGLKKRGLVPPVLGEEPDGGRPGGKTR